MTGLDVSAPPPPIADEHSSRPRTWTPFVTVLIGFVVGTAAVFGVAFLVSILLAVMGETESEILSFLTTTPIGLVLLLAPVQVVIGAAATAHAYLSSRRAASGRPPMRETLGLDRPRGLGLGGWVAILVAGGVPFGLALLTASVLPSLGPMEGVLEVWSSAPPAQAALWVAFIGLGPGICEELIFRGLLQRRLLRRWSPPVAIGVTSVLFAFVHLDPPAMGLALVLGVWIGIVAWRTNSVIPGMAIHASMNSAWNAAQIVGNQSGIDERSATWIAVAIGLVSLIAFPFAIVTLVRAPQPGPGCTGRGVGDAAC